MFYFRVAVVLRFREGALANGDGINKFVFLSGPCDMLLLGASQIA